MSITTPDSLDVLQQWFSEKCDRHWENFYGVKIETTDNPGWLITVSGSEVHEGILSSLVGHLMKEYHAQFSHDATSIRVFSPTLSGSLNAMVVVLNAGGFGKTKLGAPI